MDRHNSYEILSEILSQIYFLCEESKHLEDPEEVRILMSDIKELVYEAEFEVQLLAGNTEE